MSLELNKARKVTLFIYALLVLRIFTYVPWVTVSSYYRHVDVNYGSVWFPPDGAVQVNVSIILLELVATTVVTATVFALTGPEPKQKGIIVEEVAPADNLENPSPRLIVPQTRKPKDHRLAGLIWTTIGISYMIVVFISVGLQRGIVRAVAAGVWGIIPLAVGVAILLYNTTVRKEQTKQDQ